MNGYHNNGKADMFEKNELRFTDSLYASYVYRINIIVKGLKPKIVGPSQGRIYTPLTDACACIRFNNCDTYCASFILSIK